MLNPSIEATNPSLPLGGQAERSVTEAPVGLGEAAPTVPSRADQEADLSPVCAARWAY